MCFDAIIASMLGTAFSIDREHTLSGQNWFNNACAEQPKTVQKYSSNLQTLSIIISHLIKIYSVCPVVFDFKYNTVYIESFLHFAGIILSSAFLALK